MTTECSFSSYDSDHPSGMAAADAVARTAPTTGSAPAALATVALAQFLVALDYSVIAIALPSIARDLLLGPAVAQWVVSAYAVVFAGFLPVGGRLTDRVGARRLFIVATALFGVASAVGGVTNDGTVVLAARGAQGFGAALLQPAVLGIIGSTFPAGPVRSRALAVWSSVGAAGLAVGVLAGGLLTTASWRLTFLVNVPLTVVCALGAARWFGRVRNPAARTQVPVLASVLATAAVLALVGGLTLGADRGWASTATRAALGLALAFAVGFVVNERTSRRVLIAPVLRRTRSLRTGIAATALYMASVGSEFYLVTLLLQSAKGYPPARAGVAFFPLALMVTAGSMAAGRALRTREAATVLIAGFAIAAVGLAWLAATLHGDAYVRDLLPGLVISGFGHGVIYPAMFVLGTRDVPAEHHGAAGALLTTSQYVSAAVTVAVLTLVLGAAPDSARFRTAVLITAAAAVAGIVVTVADRGRRPGATARWRR